MTPDYHHTRFAIAFTHAGASQPHPVRTAASPLRAAVVALASFAFITSSFAQVVGGLIVNQARVNTAEGGAIPAASRTDPATGSITPSAGSVNLIAGRDINLSTVTTGESYRVNFDSRRHVAQSATRETGSAISAT